MLQSLKPTTFKNKEWHLITKLNINTRAIKNEGNVTITTMKYRKKVSFTEAILINYAILM